MSKVVTKTRTVARDLGELAEWFWSKREGKYSYIDSEQGYRDRVKVYDDRVVWVLWTTPIAEWHFNEDRLVLRTGGWNTLLTQSRINAILSRCPYADVTNYGVRIGKGISVFAFALAIDPHSPIPAEEIEVVLGDEWTIDLNKPLANVMPLLVKEYDKQVKLYYKRLERNKKLKKSIIMSIDKLASKLGFRVKYGDWTRIFVERIDSTLVLDVPRDGITGVVETAQDIAKKGQVLYKVMSFVERDSGRMYISAFIMGTDETGVFAIEIPPHLMFTKLSELIRRLYRVTGREIDVKRQGEIICRKIPRAPRDVSWRVVKPSYEPFHTFEEDPFMRLGRHELYAVSDVSYYPEWGYRRGLCNVR